MSDPEKEKVVIVTGGGCGIGARTAAALVSKGRQVAVITPEEYCEHEQFLIKPLKVAEETYYKDNNKRKYRGKRKRTF
jgi:NAD(P)-dependent dehydrogenase (short-subunit alcohol dehydrogenase family)